MEERESNSESGDAKFYLPTTSVTVQGQERQGRDPSTRHSPSTMTVLSELLSRDVLLIVPPLMSLK